MKKIGSTLFVFLIFFFFLCYKNEKNLVYGYEFDNENDSQYYLEDTNLSITTKDIEIDVDLLDVNLYKINVYDDSYFYIFDTNEIQSNVEIIDISFHDIYDLGIFDIHKQDIYLKVVYIYDEPQYCTIKIDLNQFESFFENSENIDKESTLGRELLNKSLSEEEMGLRNTNSPSPRMTANDEAKILTNNDYALESYHTSTALRDVDDDRITSIIPKIYFEYPGSHEYQGEGYKFYITTEAVTNYEESIKMKSKIYIIDFDLEFKTISARIDLNNNIQNKISVLVKGGFYGEYYCFKKTGSQWPSGYGFNSHKSSIVKYCGNNSFENIRLGQNVSMFGVFDENDNFAENTELNAVVSQIQYELRDVITPPKTNYYSLIIKTISKVFEKNEYLKYINVIAKGIDHVMKIDSEYVEFKNAGYSVEK